MGIDLFELKDAKDLFLEIQTAIREYHEKPNSRLFLFLVFALNHLREWIADSNYDAINAKKVSGIALNKAENFFCNIWRLKEFKTVNGLCNRSKHHLVSSHSKTSITQGFHCGSPCGDSLDQTYYLIDGIDSRIIFAAVILEYYNWFKSNGQII